MTDETRMKRADTEEDVTSGAVKASWPTTIVHFSTEKAPHLRMRLVVYGEKPEVTIEALHIDAAGDLSWRPTAEWTKEDAMRVMATAMRKRISGAAPTDIGCLIGPFGPQPVTRPRGG